MKLILRRSQKSAGMISKSVKFSLEARVQLTAEEEDSVKTYKLGGEVLYSKDRLGYNPNNLDTAGGLLKGFAAAAAIITITVDDLIRGKTVECKDISEMMGIVEQIKQACGAFKAILDSSSQFEGEETIDY